MAACRDSATLDGNCVKPAALPSIRAPALTEIVRAEADLTGQSPEEPFKTSNAPAAPATQAPISPLSRPTSPLHDPTSAPNNAPQAMPGVGCTPAPDTFCNRPLSQSSHPQDLLSNALNKNLGSFHSVDPLVAAVAPTQSEAVSAAPAATTCQSTQLPPQSAAHNPSLANPSEVIDVASEAGSTACRIPTSGLTPVPHPSSALGSNSTSTSAFDTSWVPAVSPTTHIPDATDAVYSGKAAPAARFTSQTTPISTPAPSPTQAHFLAPTEMSPWPALHETLVPTLGQNSGPAKADKSVSICSCQSKAETSAAKASTGVVQRTVSCAKPARPAKVSLAEFHNKVEAPIRHQTRSDTIPVRRYTILKRPEQGPDGQQHKGTACLQPAALDKQAALASTGLQPNR